MLRPHRKLAFELVRSGHEFRTQIGWHKVKDINGLGSIREAAKKFGVSPEAISKKKRQWERTFSMHLNCKHSEKKIKCRLSCGMVWIHHHHPDVYGIRSEGLHKNTVI